MRRGAASGGLPAVASMHAGFHEKSWDRRYVGLHVCAHVCDVRCATSYYSRGALHTGMCCVARRPWLQNHIIRPNIANRFIRAIIVRPFYIEKQRGHAHGKNITYNCQRE